VILSDPLNDVPEPVAIVVLPFLIVMELAAVFTEATRLIVYGVPTNIGEGVAESDTLIASPINIAFICACDI
jgi:hypothetical protein